MAKCNATTHMELNRAYADGENDDVTKRFQAMCFIVSADSDRYSGIWNDLNNNTFLGTDNYPKTTNSAYDVLCHCKKPAPPRQVHAPSVTVIFFQSGDTEKNKTTPGNDGISVPKLTCYRLQETGHYAVNLASSTANTRTGTQSL